MHPLRTQGSEGAALEDLWRQVCASRGTPGPDPGQRAQFLQDLDPEARRTLESVLHLAARGREQPGDLGLLSWATACTRPALLVRLAAHGLAFSGAHLFACGLALMQDGWDMQQRIAQLQDHPGDVDTLRALQPQEPGEPDEPDADLQALSAPDRQAPVDEAFYPWPDGGPPEGNAPDGNWDPMDGVPAAAASSPSTALPRLPTRFERQRPEPFPNSSGASGASGAASAGRPMDEPRQRLRLFGKAAAHTLEVTAHRRAGDFLGVHVVSIDSAHALGTGGGYAWERKLVIQLTPEEMPAVIATLMGLTPSVRFGHHGADQAKFIELRRQVGGLVLVTGEHAAVYPVPIPAATLYYVLDLFCRAMAMGREVDQPGRTVSDILMLVKSAHGF